MLRDEEQGGDAETVHIQRRRLWINKLEKVPIEICTGNIIYKAGGQDMVEYRNSQLAKIADTELMPKPDLFLHPIHNFYFASLL